MKLGLKGLVVVLAGCAPLLLALAGCAGGNAPGVGFNDAGESTKPETGADVEQDAGPSTLYATVDQAAAPTAFGPPTATSYKAGYTVIQGQAILPPLPNYTLPTVADLTLRVPSAPGSVSCDSAGMVEVEYDVSPDSNANLKQTGTTTDGYGTCMIDVTAFGPVGGRITGTFSAQLITGGLTAGAFDVEHGPEQ